MWKPWTSARWVGWPMLLRRDTAGVTSLAGEFEEDKHPRDGKGRFAEAAGESATLVGITSARPVGEPDFRQNKQVFADMREFGDKLKAIKGVRDVTVKPGVGAWLGGHEPTWVVSYKGNGEANRLLAQTGKDKNQDAVLVMRPATNPETASPIKEFVFKSPVGTRFMQAMEGTLAKTAGFGGWSWFKDGGQSVLRCAFVPQWPTDKIKSKEDFEAAAKQVSRIMAMDGHEHAVRSLGAQVDVMERTGDNGYDKVIGK